MGGGGGGGGRRGGGTRGVSQQFFRHITASHTLLGKLSQGGNALFHTDHESPESYRIDKC